MTDYKTEFLDHKKDVEGASTNTIKRYRVRVERLEDWLDEPSNYHHLVDEDGKIEFPEVTPEIASAFLTFLEDEYSPNTYRGNINTLNNMWDVLREREDVEEVDGTNPWSYAQDRLPSNSQCGDSHRRHVSLDEMRGAIRSVNHPLLKCVLMTLAMTGIRAGELVNLDLRDVNIDDSEVVAMYKALGVEVRTEIKGDPDTLYIASDIEKGDEVNGEVREEANKRMSPTKVPLTPELKAALKRWLAVRPDTTSPALFVNVDRDWGARLSRAALQGMVNKHADEQGWRDEGAGVSSNVSPHYYRHWFSTVLRKGWGDTPTMTREEVKYLRGDLGQDVLDDYTHSWATEVRPKYLRAMPKFF